MGLSALIYRIDSREYDAAPPAEAWALVDAGLASFPGGIGPARPEPVAVPSVSIPEPARPSAPKHQRRSHK